MTITSRYLLLFALMAALSASVYAVTSYLLDPPAPAAGWSWGSGD